ncbi:hypothetical protein IC620_16705, partial [Hazenella sp. IB182357]
KAMHKLVAILCIFYLPNTDVELSDEEIEKIKQHSMVATIIKDYADQPVYQDLINKANEEDKKADTIAKENQKKYYSPSDDEINGVTRAEFATKAFRAELDKNYREFAKFITSELKTKYTKEKENSWRKIDWNSSGEEEEGLITVVQEAEGKNDNFFYKVTRAYWDTNIYEVSKSNSNWIVVEDYTGWDKIQEKVEIKELVYDWNGDKIK